MATMRLDPQSLTTLLPRIVAIARSAGAAILDIYAREFSVSLKHDQSPLTAADLAAHASIAAALKDLTPDIPQLSEESTPADIAARRSWSTLWLIDPLDGTREFVQKNGEFTVNIALIHAHQPLLGVVYAPVPNLLYAGAHGVGAWRIDAHDQRTPLVPRATAAHPPRVLASRSHRGASLDGLLTRLGAHETLSVGSALKFGYLADGRADLYPRLSPTSEWDTAAGQAVVEAAGARVCDLQGHPLRYNARDTLLNPSFLCWMDDTRDWLALVDKP